MVNDFSAFTGNQHVLPSITDQNLINNFFSSNPSDLRNKKIHSFHLTLVK